MRGKVKAVLILSCVLNILFVMITIKNYMKPDIYVDPSDVFTITIVNVNENVAKRVIEKDYIKDICNAFNHVDVTHVKDYDEYSRREKAGNNAYEFHFIMNNFTQKIFIYRPGECVIHNGEIYETTNTEMEKLWDIEEPITEWTPERFG